MSEKINEDNCVLEDFELDNINDAFYWYIKREGEDMKDIFNEYHKKITKLNDLAKKKKE